MTSNRLTQPLETLLEADVGDWQPLLQAWQRSAPGQSLIAAVDERVAEGATVYPAQVFRAFELTPLAATKVVILGQDPYHGPNQAEGLAFSVADGQRFPPSLRNIFKELHREFGQPLPTSGSLIPWAERGVLLLNATLTVEDATAARHARLGWAVLTDAVCKALVDDRAPKVFLLWGTHAQGHAPLLSAHPQHLVLQSNHPSPLSALRQPLPFLGNGHFSRANEFLTAAGRGPVDWRLR